MTTEFIKPMSCKNPDGVRIVNGVLHAGDQGGANMTRVPLNADDRAELLYRAESLWNPKTLHAATFNHFGERVAQVGKGGTRISMLTHNDNTGETVLFYGGVHGGVIIHFITPTLGELVSALKRFERDTAQASPAARQYHRCG